jgi:hypothetical protein
MSIRTRDSIEIKQYERAEQEREQRIRDENERPAREALAEHEQLLREQRQLELEAITSGKPDPAFVVPASIGGLRMSLAEAQSFNKREAVKFAEENPEYFPCAENLQLLAKYFSAQKVQIFDAETIKQAWLRLRGLGLMIERPALSSKDLTAEAQRIAAETDWNSEESVLASKTRLEQLQATTIQDGPEQEPEPDARHDYFSKTVFTDDTGKTYTESQLNALPADDFRKLMRIKKINGYAGSQKRH